MAEKIGRFGVHGGQYIPETLMNAVIELEEAYDHYKDDKDFKKELSDLFNDYAGRPSRLYFAKKMTEDLGGAKIYLKREDLNHTGSITFLDRHFLPKRWARHVLSQRQARDSMEWLQPRQPHCLVWNALFLWERKILRDRR